MSIRSQLENDQTVICKNHNDAFEPNWVRDGSKTTKILFKEVEAEFSRIKNGIESNAELNLKSRKIVRATIATKNGFDRSLLTPRRQLELCDWIDRRNMELSEIYKLYKTNKPIRASKTKLSLEVELSTLKKSIQKNTENDRRAIVEAFFASNLLVDQTVIKRENNRLKIENDELNDTIARLRKRCKENEETISKLWEKKTKRLNAKPKQIK